MASEGLVEALPGEGFGSCGGGGRLAEVERRGLTVSAPVDKEASSPKTAGLGSGDAEGESCGNRSVHRVATCTKHFEAGLRSGRRLRGDHTTLTTHSIPVLRALDRLRIADSGGQK